MANNSLPWVFDSCTLLGVLDEIARGDFLAPGGAAAIVSGTTHQEQGTLPLNWTVTEFE
ncbi:MAG TPA: hypothetical protein VEW66_09255 [Thermomicrobiales bacterium]|nr:hypothetical protein [Thermomicrobiales bacterium]